MVNERLNESTGRQLHSQAQNWLQEWAIPVGCRDMSRQQGAREASWFGRAPVFADLRDGKGGAVRCWCQGVCPPSCLTSSLASSHSGKVEHLGKPCTRAPCQSALSVWGSPMGLCPPSSDTTPELLTQPSPAAGTTKAGVAPRTGCVSLWAGVACQ